MSLFFWEFLLEIRKKVTEEFYNEQRCHNCIGYLGCCLVSYIYFFSSYLWCFSMPTFFIAMASDIVNSQSVHIHCRHTILAHLFFRDFSFPILILSSSFSLSLSYSPFSLSAPVPPFLSFHLRLFNLFKSFTFTPLSSP